MNRTIREERRAAAIERYLSIKFAVAAIVETHAKMRETPLSFSLKVLFGVVAIVGVTSRDDR